MEIQRLSSPPQVAASRPAAVPTPPPADPRDEVSLNADPRPWSNVQAPATRVESLPDGRLKVDTVRWGFDETGKPDDWPGKFADATIDPKHIKNVYLGIKPFNPETLAAHSVLIFEMDDDHPVTNSLGQKDSGLVLSMEARTHQGEHYQMLKTLNGNYPTVYQLGTWTDLVEKTTRRESHRQIRYRLDLNEEQKEQLLRNTLAESTADHSKDMYNLFTNSCHSVCIDLVNTVLPKGQRMHRWLLPHIYNPMAALPPYGDILFAGHHLLAHEQRLMIEPDPILHPGAEKLKTKLGSVVEHLSSSRLWKPLCGLGGAAAAGAAISLLAPPLGIALAAAGGGYLGLSLGETLERRTHTDYEPSQKYFQK